MRGGGCFCKPWKTYRDATTDRGFTIKLTVVTEPEEEIVVHDPTLGRDIIIKHSGHNSAVVWNPWQEGAQSMADMQDDGYQHMLCVESVWYAPTIEEGKTVQPAKTYQLSTNISSRPR